MSKFLFCVSLICLVGSCSMLELRSICEQDHFNYSNILVNAVHLEEKEISLGNVSEFAVVSVDNCEEEDEEEGGRKFYNKRKDQLYNKHKDQLYNEHKDQLMDLKRKQ